MESARPAEAVRIASGIGAWKKTEVSYLLLGEAVRVIATDPFDFVDEDNFTRYLPMALEGKRPFYVDSAFADWSALDGTQYPFEKIVKEDIPAIMAGFDRFIVM